MRAAGPADSSTFSKPFPKQSTSSQFPSGRQQRVLSTSAKFGVSDFNEQGGDSHWHPSSQNLHPPELCGSTRPNTCMSLADSVTCPSFWPHSFSIPKTCFTSHQHPPNAPRRPGSIFLFWLAPSHLPIDHAKL